MTSFPLFCSAMDHFYEQQQPTAIQPAGVLVSCATNTATIRYAQQVSLQ